jgi:hypothetical protein
MDMLVYNGTPTEQEYFNTCITNAVPLIKSFSLADLEQLSNIIVNYNAEILSTMSILNRYIYLMIHNIVNLESGTYAEDLGRMMLPISNSYLNVTNMNVLKGKIDTMVLVLNILKTKIETLYSLAPGSLSLYNYDSIEEGINLSQEKSNTPVVLTYVEGKAVLRKLTSIVQTFIEIKSNVEDNDATLHSGLSSKNDSILTQRANELKSMIEASQNLEALKDSCFLAIVAYTDCNLNSKVAVDTFVSRRFTAIKDDILRESAKYL